MSRSGGIESWQCLGPRWLLSQSSSPYQESRSHITDLYRWAVMDSVDATAVAVARAASDCAPGPGEAILIAHQEGNAGPPVTIISCFCVVTGTVWLVYHATAFVGVQ